MGKMRVYQLAKELQIENKDLLKAIKKLGLDVKSHMSVLDDESAKSITAAVKSPAPKAAKAKKKAAAPAKKKPTAAKET